MKKESGITIVALVVTIVVMLILVGVSVTVSINGGLFNTTKESTYKTEVSQVKEALEEEIVQRKARRESTDNITIADLDIPDKIKEKYKDKLIIIGKDIYYDPANIKKDNEEAWLEDMDISTNTKFFTYNSNGDTITGLSEFGYTAIENGVTKFVMPTKYVSKDANGNRKVTTITTIGANAFNATLEGKEKCVKIKSIVFPTTLTTLKTNAFEGCNGLEKIDLNNTQIGAIENYSFRNCSNLAEVKAPNTLKSIGESSFENCKNLLKIDLSNTQIGAIGNYSFRNCSNLAEVKAPDTLKSIGAASFANCKNLLKIDLSKTQVTYIGQYAFSYCMNLKEAILPENLTGLDSFAFWHCEKMEKVNLGRITTVRPYCFQYCTSLKNIEIPDSVTYIAERSFQCCSSLEKLIIPSSVTSIIFEAFMWDSAIQEIRIPSSVTTMSYNVFSQSAKGGKMYVPFTKEEGKPSGWSSEWNKSGATIIYADETT